MSYTPRAVHLREFRDRHGMTQSNLAAQLGVDLRTVQRWERGEPNPGRMLALALDELDRRLSR